MAEKSLPQRASRTPRRTKHSLKEPFSGKSQPSDPSNVVALYGPGEGLPSSLNGKVPPRRIPNKERRAREYLTEREVDQLIDAARKAGRYGHRDATLILLAYRHGLRVAELVALRWDQIDLSQGLLHVARAKNGTPSTHPVRGPEIRALRRLKRVYAGPYVFMTERQGPLTPSVVRKIVARSGERAGLGFPVHPHMLRHACGFKLANDGHDTRAIQHYLGHRCITHTTRYTDLAAGRFNGFWKD
jgi:type 1 fimbriae regulatory protein FimB/type 1 fimbriae regulatory protein FimE